MKNAFLENQVSEQTNSKVLNVKIHSVVFFSNANKQFTFTWQNSCMDTAAERTLIGNN